MSSITTTFSEQVRLSFTTRDDSIKLPEGTSTILVSSAFKRYQLSTLINQLLENERAVPFEFLVNGRFLKTSIQEFLTATGLSSEILLTVEYTRATVPPSESISFEHNDWISAVDVLSSSSPISTIAGTSATILSAGYDGLLRVWSTSAQVLAISPSTSPYASVPQPIKAVKFLTPSKIVSAGHDRIVRLWTLKSCESQGQKLEPSLELIGHKHSVDSIAIHGSSSRILSASSDATLCLWSSKLSESASTKRRKTDVNGKLKGASVAQGGPLATLISHIRPVSQGVFDVLDSTVAYSCSWDASVITWDLTTSVAVSVRRTTHPLLSLLHLRKSNNPLNLLATGTSARHITMIDPRADVRSVSAGITLRGHTSPAVCLAADPYKPWGLVSAGLDGVCRVWDLRSASSQPGTDNAQVCDSIFVLRGQHIPKGSDAEKLLAVTWDRDVGIVCGGEDRRIRVFSATGENLGQDRIVHT